MIKNMKSFWKKRVSPFLSKMFPGLGEKIGNFIDPLLYFNYREWRELTPPREFDEWSHSRIKSAGGNPIYTKQIVNQITQDTQKEANDDSILERIMLLGRLKERTRLTVNDGTIDKYFLDFSESGEGRRNPQRDMDLTSPHFHILEISTSNEFHIKGAVIEFLDITRGARKKVVIENSCIGKLVISRGNPINNFKIQDSWIGTLSVGQESIMDLRIQGGWICNFEVPATYVNSPFVGSVDFKKLKLPTSGAKSILFQGSQQYRNLRVHFEKLQNGPMAGLMRAKELASERETDPVGVSWLFNWVYCIASGYGQKPGRALIWCLFFLAISTVNLILTNGVWIDPDAKMASHYGWAVGEPSGKLGNAFILTLQTAINPFTIFITKAAFKFKSYIELLQTLFYVLLADGAFLFCVFAIRKRLKFS